MELGEFLRTCDIDSQELDNGIKALEEQGECQIKLPHPDHNSIRNIFTNATLLFGQYDFSIQHTETELLELRLIIKKAKRGSVTDQIRTFATIRDVFFSSELAYQAVKSLKEESQARILLPSYCKKGVVVKALSKDLGELLIYTEQSGAKVYIIIKKR